MSNIILQQNNDTDVIIIGGGASGMIAAQTLASKNKKVVVVEQNKIGGSIAYNGTIPTRALLETANSYNNSKIALKYGINTSSAINLNSVFNWRKRAINCTGVNNINKDKLNNIKIIKGHGHFINKNTVSVGLNRYKAKKIIIATGSKFKQPNIDGLSDIPYYTTNNIYSSSQLPKYIAIIGGGTEAYEHAQILNTLNVKVCIFEKNKHLLPKLDQEAGDMAQYVLEKDNIKIKTLCNVSYINKENGNININYIHKNKTYTHSTQAVLLCIGKSPNIDIGLVNTNIKYNEYGVIVKNNLQTSQKNVFAVGSSANIVDSDAGTLFSGQVAAHNILHRKNILYNSRIIPKACFGPTEIAHVGVTEKQVRLTGLPYQTAITPIKIVGRSMTNAYSDGFVKIIASHYGILMGATIVSPRASEIINEITFAIQHKHRACDIANTLHVFSSWSEAIRVASSKIKCI